MSADAVAAALSAVLAAPEDNAARLLLSRALDAAGDARGELIRLQLRRWSVGALEPEPRELALLAAETGRWAAPLYSLGVRAVELFRGVPGGITMNINDFLTAGERIFELAPVRHLRLEGAPARCAELMRAPALARLHALSWCDAGLGDGEAELLAAAPAAGRLRWLDLGGNRIGPAGVGALAASPHLGRLGFVSLRGNPGEPALPARWRAGATPPHPDRMASRLP